MAQVRDATFHPSSPHSSSAGADSYNHEGTPDTRLTAFSPDDNSARSNKLLTALSLNASSDRPVHFKVEPAEGFGGGPVAAEKDPFFSGTTAPKAEQKLSPTASSFRPVSVPLVAHGSLNGLPGLNVGLGVDRQLFAPSVTGKFSSELGVSRYLVLYAPSHAVTLSDAEGYLEVRLLPLVVQLPVGTVVDTRHRSWSGSARHAWADATRLRWTAESVSGSPTYGTPAMSTTTSVLVLLIGVLNTSPRLSSTRLVSSFSSDAPQPANV